MQLVGPGRVSHDFGAAPFCTVRLLLRVRNTLPSPASVCIEAGKAADGRPTPLGEWGIGWAGCFLARWSLSSGLGEAS